MSRYSACGQHSLPDKVQEVSALQPIQGYGALLFVVLLFHRDEERNETSAIRLKCLEPIKGFPTSSKPRRIPKKSSQLVQSSTYTFSGELGTYEERLLSRTHWSHSSLLESPMQHTDGKNCASRRGESMQRNCLATRWSDENKRQSRFLRCPTRKQDDRVRA